MNPLIVRCHRLSPIRPIYLDAIVLLGVVGGSDHDPRQALERDDGEGYKGCRDHPSEEEHLEVVVQEHGGDELGKPLAIVPAIVANDHALCLPLLDAWIGIDEVGADALGHFDDHHIVQGVEACAHHAPQTSG